MAEDIIHSEESLDVESIGSRISDGIIQIIEQSKYTVAVYLNTEVTLTYWRIGRCIAKELDAISDEKYGSKIVSTVSRQLTERYGKGYQRANLFRMLKVARVFPDEETFSTLSRQLTWSHFVELSVIKENISHYCEATIDHLLFSYQEKEDQKRQMKQKVLNEKELQLWN